MRHYKVDEATLRDLLIRGHYYEALEHGGVDNWEWHGASISDYIDDCSAIDEVHYESIEEIVEADLTNFEVIQ